MKKLFVWLITVICIAAMYVQPRVMLSPGHLVEGHQKMKDDCSSCHQPFGGISNDKCISCHKLADIGKDSLQQNKSDSTVKKILFHERLSAQKCTTCHSDHKGLNPGTTISRFSHDILRKSELNDCMGCHEKPFDRLHSQVSTTCNNCHNINGWKFSVKFNHEMIQGSIKNNCASCHQGPHDSFHQQVKDNCDKCHSTNKWIPSTFDHSTYFYLDGNHNAKCNVCHTSSNMGTYTCYGCHEHSENSIAGEHNEEGIYNFSNCVSCHRSSNEHDIRNGGDPNQGEIRTGNAAGRNEHEGGEGDD